MANNQNTQNSNNKEDDTKKVNNLITFYNTVSKLYNADLDEHKAKYREHKEPACYGNSQEEKELKSILDEWKYSVKIIENLDALDVSSDERYQIVIENTENHISVKFSLMEYRRKLVDYDFDPVDFMEDKLLQIEGAPTFIDIGNGQKVNKIQYLADNILEYLSYILYDRSKYTYTYSTLGWDIIPWNRDKYLNIIFKYNIMYSRIPDATGILVNNPVAEDISYSGTDTTNWLRYTVEMLNNYVYDCLLIGAGVSGVLRQFLTFTKETNININIKGAPGSGKSTIGHYILSIFGNPYMLEGANTDTDNAMEQLRVQRSILPYILDDRMLKYIDTSDKKKSYSILMDIFREYEGKEKQRLGKQYGNTSGQRSYGPVISSSVDSMLDMIIVNRDLGQFRRFMEFDIKTSNEKMLFDSNLANKVELESSRCYGMAIVEIVHYMLDRTLENITKKKHVFCNSIIQRTSSTFTETNMKFDDRFKNLNEKIKVVLKAKQDSLNSAGIPIIGMEASSLRFALIVLSYQVYRESIIYWIDNEKDPDIDTRTASGIEELYSELASKVTEKGADSEPDSKGTGAGIEIADKSEDIIKILVDNLAEKLQRNYKHNMPKSDLFTWLEKNENIFTTNRDDVNRDADGLIGYLEYDSESTEYKIIYPKYYHLEYILFKPIIPDRDTIKKYVAEVRECKGQNKKINSKIRKDIIEIAKNYGGIIEQDSINKFKESNNNITYTPETNINASDKKKTEEDVHAKMLCGVITVKKPKDIEGEQNNVSE